VATASYLDDVPGGMVTAAAFEDDDAAVSAVTLLRESGVREQDISVIAKDRHRAELVAGGRAWLPLKGWRGLVVRLRAMLGRGLPRDLRQRYGDALVAGKIVVIVAAGGQPPDTIAALLKQSRGEQIEQSCQPPTMLFAPRELAGPF